MDAGEPPSVDPEALEALRVLLAAGDSPSFWPPDIATRRAFFRRMQTEGRDDGALRARVEQADHTMRSEDGTPVRLQVSRPSRGGAPALPAVLCVHGGGFVIGGIETDQGQVLPLVDELGAVVVGVDYRLAPEHPHPTPVDDCHAALSWMVANAAHIGIDPDRIALFGTSAGGGLAAAVALLARDRGTAAPVLQVLAYPMLDDRSDTASSHDVPALGLWDRPINVEGWRHLLGDRFGTEEVSPYAAPARADDLRGLCPAYVDVGELDILRDESISYATRLLQAGVPTELHVVPGAYHACEQVAPESDVARRIVGYRMAALRRALRIAG